MPSGTLPLTASNRYLGARVIPGLFYFHAMKFQKTILAVLALIAFLAELPEAKKAPTRVRNVVPADCQVMADSLQKLYDAGDPVYLTWSISPHCDDSQRYLAYYYQGLGFYLLSAWKESLYFLTLAKEIGGAKDEEILYHLWNVNKKLDKYQEMERATLELHRRYPNSFFLMEILDQWKTVKHPSQPWTFNYTTKVGFANNDFLNNVFSNRLRATTNQRRGFHRFRETGSLTVKTKFPSFISDSTRSGPKDTLSLQGVQGNLGGEYEYKGLSLQLDYGASYESHNASGPMIFVQNGLQNRLVDSNWNWLQGRAALGYSMTTRAGWNLGGNLSAMQLSRDWQAFGISHSQSFLFPSWMLLGYLDYQIHSLNLPLAPGDPTYPIALDGMTTFMANVTPYFTKDRHSVGLGLTYYRSESHYIHTTGVDPNDLAPLENSLTGTLSYVFDMKSWLKFNMDTSYGWEYNKSDFSGGVLALFRKKVYALDLGASFSF